MNTLRVGLDGKRAAVLEAVRAAGAPVLVSANNLWNPKRKRFKATEHLDGLDVALDPGGFTAMRAHGGYRFGALAYVDLAERLNPTWWAGVDYCCEPEAPVGGTTTWQRQLAGANLYGICHREARRRGIKPPMPVLQGWRPEDYRRSAAFLFDHVHWRLWPDLIGIGSVCRRPLYGSDGLLRVIGCLDSFLPARLRFHLFGVKGAALSVLASHPRFGSMDSCAYDAGNRQDHRKNKQPRTNLVRAAALTAWLEKQRVRADVSQPDLFCSAYNKA